MTFTSRKNLKIVLSSVLFVSLVALPMYSRPITANLAQESNKYDAETVLKRIYGLTEFPDTTLTPNSYSLTGTAEHAGISGHFTTLYDKRNGYVNSLDLGFFGASQWLNDSGGWELNPNQIVNELSILNEKMLALVRIIESREYLSAPKSALRRECLGPGEYDSRGVFQFRFSTREEITGDVYIDSTNGQVIALQLQYDFIDIEFVFSDFREVEEIEFAFHSEVTASLAELNMTTQVTTGTVNQTLANSTFATPTTDQTDVSFPADLDSVMTGLEYYQGHLYFRVRINGSEPLLFLLDSGANGLVIDAYHVESLGLEPSGSQSGLGVAGSTEFSFAKIDEMNISGIVLKNQLASVISLGSALRSSLQNIVGVIGYDFLARFVVTIDFAREQMTIFPPTTDVTSGASDIKAVVPLDFYFNLPTVVAKVNDKPGVFLVDAGNSFGTLLHEYFVTANSFEDLPERAPVNGKRSVGGIGGSLPTKAITIASFELADIRIQDQPAWAVLGSVGASASKILAGNLGNGFWDQYRVTFDYPHNRLILRNRAVN